MLDVFLSSFLKHLFTKQARLRPNTISCNSALSACSASGNWQIAVHVLSSSMSDATAHPDQISCNAALNACRGAGEWITALRLLERMPEMEVEPDEITYNSAISSCEMTANWRIALDLLAEMQSSQLRLGTVAISSAMSACRASGRWQDALHLCRLMAESFIKADQISLTTLIGACENGGRWPVALHIFDQRDLQDFDTAFASAAIKACSTRGQWLESLRVFRNLLDAGRQPDLLCYTMLVHGCGKGTQIGLASELLRSMPDISLSPDAAAFNSVINSCAGHSWVQACALLHDMQTVTCQPNPLTWTSVLAAVKAEGEWQMALEILAEMMKIRMDADAAPLACPASIPFLLRCCEGVQC